MADATVPGTMGTARVSPLGIGLSDTDSDGGGILLRADPLADRIAALDVAVLAGDTGLDSDSD